jgi:hypothetical protein
MNNKLSALTEPFVALKNRVFAGLYFAENETIIPWISLWLYQSTPLLSHYVQQTVSSDSGSFLFSCELVL